jgi:hypothetical protein
MRRLAVIIGALALMAPPLAAALARGPGDGTLVVQNAKGIVQLRVTGGIIGRFDSGQIEVFDPTLADGPAAVVKLCQDTSPGPKRFSCFSETEVRFRLIGGSFIVRIDAIGVDLSVVGHGTAVLDGQDFEDFQTGRYSVNGGPFQLMPPVPTKISIGAPQPATLGSK